MNVHELEQEAAAYLVSMSTDLVQTYTEDPEDLDAAVVALLACALEFASNRQLKPLEEIWNSTTSLG